MEECIPEEPKTDVRILTLKRWNFPQTARLFPDSSNPAADEEYISYNSHHFIRIEKCESTPKKNPISWAYHSLEMLRKSQCDTVNADNHVVQSLSLLGEGGEFWDEPGDVLYISFLQLTNAAVTCMEEVKKAIDPIVKAWAPNASWTLYHSLDFCDLVLFTKNISYMECSNILRELSIVRGKEMSVLRDTFTIYGFRQSFLKDAFQKKDQSESVKWDDHAVLSVQLSIQSYEVWQRFEGGLKKANIPFCHWRVFGRYDIRLVTGMLSGGQILYLLYLLDSMAIESKDRAFGGYEISMEDLWVDNIKGTPTDATQDRGFEKAATAAMDTLCEQCAKAYPDSADYAYETKRSLEALLKNGFSEEFVLSVLPTFLCFLQIAIDVQDYCSRMKPEKDMEIQLKGSQGKMMRHYFNALNVLALCTMHSERQFIQAPAFNAAYFDVPPKLLAFYSAVARKISTALKTENGKDYHFLFVPNYQKDINIRPLELEMEEDPSQHLAVAHLHESYFYDPIFSIKLFCHEAAHYLSDRKREDRAKYIFRAISFLLLANTPLRYIAKLEQDNSVLAVMADSLADFMMEKYLEEPPHCTRGIHFHLQDISDFLSCNAYGIDFFADTLDANRICKGWQKILCEKATREPDTFGVLFGNGLACIQCTLQSDYLTELFQEDQDGMYVYEVFSRVIAYYATFPYGPPEVDEFNNICENIIQAFSEAYADLRMSELIGDEFSWEDYEDLFQAVDVNNYYQKILRHDAMLRVVDPNGKWSPLIIHENNNLSLFYAAKQIEEYLELCHKNPVSSTEVVQILRNFQKDDISKQWNLIRTTIQNYRQYLTQCCQEIIVNYRPLKDSLHADKY